MDVVTSLWQALLDGSWSIIGRYRREDRQVLVARKHDSTLMKARALTQRERQIVDRAGAGRSNKQIASEVGLSIGRVSGYLSCAMRKMGLRSRAELLLVAVTRGASHAPRAPSLSAFVNGPPDRP
jgi:DNA-binding NarL/FixJ family response regulator